MADVHELSNLRIAEISLVDEGDNHHADIAFVKRRQPGDPDGRLETIIKGIEAAISDGGDPTGEAALAVEFLKGMGGNMTDIEKRLAEIEANLDTVTKAKDAAEAKVAELEGQLATEIAKSKPAATEEDILKSLPEPVRKRFEELERTTAIATAAFEKARDEKEEGEYIAKAKSFKVGDATVLGGLMLRVAKGKTTAADVATLEGVLKQAATIEKSSPLFRSAGSSETVEGDDPEAVLKQAALDIQKAKPGLTYEAAYSEALDANPAVYDAFVKSRRR